MNSKILVVGGEGFIGRNFKEAYSDDVITMDVLPTADIVFDATQFNWPEVENVRAVVCMASIPNIWGSSEEDTPHVHHESIILRRAIEFCTKHKVKYLVHLSSSNVYNIGNIRVPFQESSVITTAHGQDILKMHPHRHRYGRQKALAEQVLSQEAMRSDRLSSVSIRLFNVIGKYQRPTMFPYIVADAFVTGKRLPMRETMRRAWTPVEDVIKFIRACTRYSGVSRGHHVFNYGVGSRSWSQHELVMEMTSVWETEIGERPRYIDFEDLPAIDGEMKVSVPDMYRMATQFGRVHLPNPDLRSSLRDVFITRIKQLEAH